MPVMMNAIERKPVRIISKEWPHQTQQVSETISLLSCETEGVLVVSPTGSGKTRVMCRIVQEHPFSSIAIVVHSRVQFYQAEEALRVAGVSDYGVIRGSWGKGDNPVFDQSKRIQVAMIQALRAKSNYAGFDLLILDEAHHAPMRSFQKIRKQNPQAKLLGFTATPCRLDNQDLMSAGFDKLVLGPSIPELTPRYLKSALIWAPAGFHRHGVKLDHGEFDHKDRERHTNTAVITGNVIKHYQKHANGLTGLAYCSSIKHAEDLAAAFRESGIPADFISGRTPMDERHRILSSLEAGVLKVLCSYDVISEGFDLPDVGCIMLLRATMSLSLCIQQVGRGLRKKRGTTGYDDEQNLIVLDHVGNCAAHGWIPSVVIDWAEKQGEARGIKEETQGVRRCNECDALYHKSLPACPACGAEPSTRERKDGWIEVDGELVPMVPNARTAPPMRKKNKNKSKGKGDHWEVIVRGKGVYLSTRDDWAKERYDRGISEWIGRGYRWPSTHEEVKQMFALTEGQIDLQRSKGIELSRPKRVMAKPAPKGEPPFLRARPHMNGGMRYYIKLNTWTVLLGADLGEAARHYAAGIVKWEQNNKQWPTDETTTREWFDLDAKRVMKGGATHPPPPGGLGSPGGG